MHKFIIEQSYLWNTGVIPSGQFHHRDMDENKYLSQMWLRNGEQNGAAENCDPQQNSDLSEILKGKKASTT